MQVNFAAAGMCVAVFKAICHELFCVFVGGFKAIVLFGVLKHLLCHSIVCHIAFGCCGWVVAPAVVIVMRLLSP